MREFTVERTSDGKRLDRWLQAEMPLLSKGACQKYIRLKKVRVNGAVGKSDTRLMTGDTIRIYLGDELFEKPHKTDALLSQFHYHLNIAYEDANILIVDKRPGIIVHGDATVKLNTLVTHVRAYLYQKGEYDSMAEGAFAPAPCNRIDRFTGGLVIFAKKREALRAVDSMIKAHEIIKHYVCIIHGEINPTYGMLEGEILKTPGRRKVEVFDRPIQGSQHAITRYETISSTGELSLVDCELVTGRTHQIRAQFAHAGHALLGDGQYGDYEDSRAFDRDFQALYAYRLDFVLKNDYGELNYLNGRRVTAKYVPFIADYFPQFYG